jgi:hypothetical protein
VVSTFIAGDDDHIDFETVDGLQEEGVPTKPALPPLMTQEVH